MGRFDPKKHRDFVLIPAKYADREGMYMRRDAYDAFLKMTTKAQEAGGTSRHHWGTDIDLNSFNNKYFESGKGKKIYDWLTSNASSFGFCQPYTPKGDHRPHGYNEEKWHWSYQPVSQDITDYAEQYLRNEILEANMSLKSNFVSSLAYQKLKYCILCYLCSRPRFYKK